MGPRRRNDEGEHGGRRQLPLLLVDFRDGELMIQDGNRRRDALVDAGASHVWALVWFDTPLSAPNSALRIRPSTMADRFPMPNLTVTSFRAIRFRRRGVHPRSWLLGGRRGREFEREC